MYCFGLLLVWWSWHFNHQWALGDSVNPFNSWTLSQLKSTRPSKPVNPSQACYLAIHPPKPKQNILVSKHSPTNPRHKPLPTLSNPKHSAPPAHLQAFNLSLLLLLFRLLHHDLIFDRLNLVLLSLQDVSREDVRTSGSGALDLSTREWGLWNQGSKNKSQTDYNRVFGLVR